MSGKLSGRVALVTGASKGIGAAIAVHLAAEGAAVVVNYASSKAGADRVVATIADAGGRAVAVGADMTDPEAIGRLFAETKRAFGRLDILVNNAGIYEFAAIEEITPEHYRRQFDLNVLGLLLATREAVKLFGDGGGRIINISSVVATATPPQTAVYSGTKAAVDAITRSLAQELGPRGILVNAVNPGPVATEGTQSLGFHEGETHDQMIRQIPLGRIGQVDDIAPAVVYLAGDESAWLTGQTLTISGGMR